MSLALIMPHPFLLYHLPPALAELDLQHPDVRQQKATSAGGKCALATLTVHAVQAYGSRVEMGAGFSVLTPL